MVTDRIGDFIIRLQNAALVGKARTRVPYSAYLFAIAKKLKELGFLTDVSVEAKGEGDTKKEILATLAYDEHGTARLRGVKRVSKPGRRLYTGADAAHSVKGGTGVRILSTSAGIISDAEARTQKVGGENLFEIW